MANTPVINLRRGQAVRHNNDVCIITEMEHKTPPRMASYVQMSIRSISSGRVHNLRLTSNESLDHVNLSKVDHEYSYKDNTGYHFLHTETYDDVLLNADMVDPVKDYLVEGQKYVLLFTDEVVCSIELPPSMTLTVAESPEGVKGDSSSNVFKTAIMETGLAVQVPLFIGPGEKINVKTEDGSYLGRA
jgi:elongation factor P